MPLAVAVGATSRLAIFGVIPIVSRSMKISTPIGRVTRNTTGLGDIVAFARYTLHVARPSGLDVADRAVRRCQDANRRQ